MFGLSSGGTFIPPAIACHFVTNTTGCRLVPSKGRSEKAEGKMKIRMKPSKDVLVFWSYFLGLLGKVDLGRNFLRGVGKLI